MRPCRGSVATTDNGHLRAGSDYMETSVGKQPQRQQDASLTGIHRASFWQARSLGIIKSESHSTEPRADGSTSKLETLLAHYGFLEVKKQILNRAPLTLASRFHDFLQGAVELLNCFERH